jgi:hypothetical protein
MAFKGFRSLASAGSRCRRGLAHNLLCNPHYVVFSAIWASCQLPIRTSPMHVLKGGMACARKCYGQCQEVLWPVPGSVKVVGSHDNAFNGVCLRRLFFEFAALPRAQV